VRKHIRSQVNLIETGLGLAFWLCTLLLAMFPDEISTKLAKMFGIKDNINAVMFILIGLLGVIQFRLFNILRGQDKALTAIIRQLAIMDHDKSKNEDSVRS
jgi:hypothetical protein